ncbi:MAG TPA: TraB/GumN family protein [Candidatus Binatia bacterium]|nr:TraB/GumN family protein [Candidatus Binatia bacterium]
MSLRTAGWMLAAALAPGVMAADKPQSAPAPAPDTVAAPFLWEVQGAKAKHYLLGSVHMLPQSTQPLPLALDAAYATTRGTVFESDIGRLNSPELQAKMIGAGTEDRAGGLKKRIGPAQWDKLQKRARKLGLPTPICATFRAWLCALTLELSSVQQAGFDAAFGIDQYFYGKAIDDGRALTWLETPEQQLELFTGMPDAMATQFLGATLDGMTDSSMAPGELEHVWRSGDLAAVQKEMDALHAKYPEVYARLLADRNKAWLPKLAELFGGESPQFVVVGAAHLPGPDGLLAALRAQGLAAVPATGAAVDAQVASVTPRDPRPKDTPWLMPFLSTRDPDAAFAFYQRAFGFAPGFTLKGDDGRLAHAELKYRDVVVMLGPESPKEKRQAPVTGKFTAPAELYLYVDDVDAAAARAKAAGAEEIEPLADQKWGDRTVLLRDPDGYLWRLATHLPGKP